MKWLVFSIGIVLIGAVGAAGTWFALWRDDGGPSASGAESSARHYFERAMAGDYDATYTMLDSGSQSAISRADWENQNQAALTATGPLKSTKVIGSEAGATDESYVTVRLEFEGHDPLDVVVRMVRDGTEWHPSLSVRAPPTDQWQHVEP